MSLIRIYQEAADLPLYQRQHDGLFDGNRRQFVVLFDVPLRRFISQSGAPGCPADADQFAKPLF